MIRPDMCCSAYLVHSYVDPKNTATHRVPEPRWGPRFDCVARACYAHPRRRALSPPHGCVGMMKTSVMPYMARRMACQMTKTTTAPMTATSIL